MKINETLDLDLEEYKLDRGDKAKLVSTVYTEGFPVLVKVAECETKKFISKLLNTPTTDKDAVLVNHMAAKLAVQLFTGFVHRINEEVLEYTYAPKESDKPLDPTSGLIDIGEYEDPSVDYFEER